MSLVLIWPSTVIRSKEAATAARRAASGSSTTASVWTKQSIVAKFGWIIPAPLAWAERVTPPARSVQLFGQRSVVRIASEKAMPPSGGERRGGLADPGEHGVDRQRHADHAGLGDGDGARVEAQLGAGPLAHRPGVGQTLLAGLGVGVAGVDDRGPHGAAVDPLPADPHRRRGGGVAGQQQRRGNLRRVADEQADVGLAAALEAAVGRPGAKAGRELRRVELLDPGGRLDPAGLEEGLGAHSNPSVSSKPSIRLRHCTAWPDAPFQRLSIAEKASTRPRSSTVT